MGDTAGGPTTRVVPISEGLGLADIEVVWETAPLGETRARATVTKPSGDTYEVDLRRRPLNEMERAAGGVAAVFTGRTMVGKAERITVTVFVDGPAGRAELPAVTTALTMDPDVRTPDWAKGAVWYQIMPERFRNGNTGNDPTPARQPGVFAKRWNSAWHEVEVDELEAARAEAVLGGPARRAAQGERDPLDQVATRRRYGGDLQGVTEKLGELKAFGVDAIYLTPIFRAPSLHKYDAADYRHIDGALGHPGSDPPMRWHEPWETHDPATWTWTAADRYVVEELLPRAHADGLRMVFDGVWNHTGKKFWAFEDVFARGKESPYLGWYDVRLAPPFGDEPIAPGDPLRYVGPGMVTGWRAWDGRNGGLPSFKQTRSKDLAPPVKQHIFDVTSRWMNPEASAGAQGIDGWRLDVAGDIGTAFWSDWRKHVKVLNPEALLIAEIWYPAQAFFGSNGFDGQMNYPMARPVIAWLCGEPGMGNTELARELGAVFCNHPATDLVQMNLLGSHDTDRVVSRIANPGRPYDDGTPRADASYRRGKPKREAYELLEVGVALLTTYTGAPMIFAGDEWGVYGGDDPDCRKPVPWPDLGPRDDPDENALPELRERVSHWLLLRRNAEIGPVLRYGALRHVETGNPDVVAFERQLNDRRVLVVLNRGSGRFDATGLVGGTARRVEPGAQTGLQVGHRSAGVFVISGGETGQAGER
ncbi:MAG: alpha-amylase family glycosyl hydrolase [Phycisphaerales bacterium]